MGKPQGPKLFRTGPQSRFQESLLTGHADLQEASGLSPLETWRSAQHPPRSLAFQAQGISRKTDRPGSGLRLRGSLVSGRASGSQIASLSLLVRHGLWEA